MGLFSGLETFGFQGKNLEIYTNDFPKENETEKNVEVKKEPIVKEEECLFPKTYKCPICDNEFKSLAVRAGKLRSVGQDDDLRPLYKDVDPIKYDAIVCPKCGYGALSRYFNHVMPTQGKTLRKEVQAKFKGMDFGTDLYTYDEAITHYKMVLMCDVIGGVKNSRKAYTCLKLAWVIRGKLEKEEPKMTPEECEVLRKEEMECIENAYEGYQMAFSMESFPMSGMDEMTLSYLIAELAFRLEKYRESLQMLSNVIASNTASSRLKERAVDLKERIRAQVKEKRTS